jgi:hypothetical protein
MPTLKWNYSAQTVSYTAYTITHTNTHTKTKDNTHTTDRDNTSTRDTIRDRDSRVRQWGIWELCIWEMVGIWVIWGTWEL